LYFPEFQYTLQNKLAWISSNDVKDNWHQFRSYVSNHAVSTFISYTRSVSEQQAQCPFSINDMPILLTGMMRIRCTQTEICGSELNIRANHIFGATPTIANKSVHSHGDSITWDEAETTPDGLQFPAEG
jgi:hypothetical protein